MSNSLWLANSPWTIVHRPFDAVESMAAGCWRRHGSANLISILLIYVGQDGGEVNSRCREIPCQRWTLQADLPTVLAGDEYTIVDLRSCIVIDRSSGLDTGCDRRQLTRMLLFFVSLRFSLMSPISGVIGHRRT